jgi:hypothetical protein
LANRAGFKEDEFGDAGVHKALVLLIMENDWSRNPSCRKGHSKNGFDKFGIHIEAEVNVI